MKAFLPQNLLNLADICHHSLFIVGGSVRDFLSGYSVPPDADWDLCSPMTDKELIAAAKRCGFSVRAVYPRTGTVKLSDGKTEYEFTRFRSDKYDRGLHAPSEVTFTDDILADALRRDFRANAVYYEIRTGTLIDPLGGIQDIHDKKLRAAAQADKVFGEDGLRLMRLCRLAAQTGFSPDGACLSAAKKHAALIRDIAPERILRELNLLLTSDDAHGERTAPYRGLCLMRETGVLRHILPELALGDRMEQRPDFHNYNVLEHSFRCVLYSPRNIRYAALLHDVGKPYCYRRDGNFHLHEQEGARLAKAILSRLKAPKALTAETERLVFLHMRDYNSQMREGKVRREILENYDVLPKLLALKQADFSACKDDLSPAPCVQKWRNVLSKMEQEGVPMRLSDLKVNGKDLQNEGVTPKDTGRVLKELMDFCAQDGARNQAETLLKYVRKNYKENL